MGTFSKGHVPWNKGKTGVYSEEWIENQRQRNTGKKHSEETKQKMSKSHIGLNTWIKGTTPWNKGLFGYTAGEKHPNWIKDRTKIVGRQDRNNPEYKQWRMAVWKRDEFKCRIKNKDCNGRIEAHHILTWSQAPELRYEINNGITLCHAHHPRTRALEEELAPVFQELVTRKEINWQ